MSSLASINRVVVNDKKKGEDESELEMSKLKNPERFNKIEKIFSLLEKTEREIIKRRNYKQDLDYFYQVSFQPQTLII